MRAAESPAIEAEDRQLRPPRKQGGNYAMSCGAPYLPPPSPSHDRPHRQEERSEPAPSQLDDAGDQHVERVDLAGKKAGAPLPAVVGDVSLEGAVLGTQA